MKSTGLENGQDSEQAAQQLLTKQTANNKPRFLSKYWWQVPAYFSYILVCILLSQLSNADLNNALSAVALFVPPYGIR